MTQRCLIKNDDGVTVAEGFHCHYYFGLLLMSWESAHGTVAPFRHHTRLYKYNDEFEAVHNGDIKSVH